MTYQDYVNLKRRIVPQLRFNQTIYEEIVAQHVSEGCVWLDAGTGWHIFPPWRQRFEQALVGKSRLALGCDTDERSLRNHHTLQRLAVADLERLPFATASMDLITCNMVVEHLYRPQAVFAEFARVLKKGGRVIVHTPNICSPLITASWAIPRRLKLTLIRALEDRTDEDVFPTWYRANSPGRIRKLMAQVGLDQEWCRTLASDAVLQRTHPLLVITELLFIRLTLWSTFKHLRISILAAFRKYH